MRLRHPPNVARVSILTKASWKRYSIAAVVVACYATAGQMWVTTAGQPYEWALAEQKRVVREKAEELKEKAVSFEAGKQDRKETELTIDYEALPSKVLPSAWACAMIFFSVASHILFHLMCHWSIGFRAAFLYQPSPRIKEGAYIWLTPNANKGKAAIVRIEESDVSLRLRFIFQYQSYEFVEPGEAVTGDLGDSDEPGVCLIQSPIDLAWAQYQKSRGLENESEIEKATDRYGPNTFELPRPTFMQLYKTQLMAPVAMFQFLCTVLWMLDTYWKYTCFTLVSILGFEASTAFQRLKSMATLRGMSTKSYNVFVYRMLKWQEVPIDDLLPGDIMSMTMSKGETTTDAGGEKEKPKDATANQNLMVPCDCLLLKGSAIVNEATLTGESVPQMKDALGTPDDEKVKVDLFKGHRMHTLFSGTSLIQATPGQKALQDGNSVDSGVPDPPNDGIVCYVVRTGFNSSQGELMRMIEFSTQEVSSDKLETAAQLLFLLMFALAAAGYVLNEGLKDPTKPTYKTLLRCTLIITSVVPPSLPMQMAFAVHTALMALLKGGIFCTEPFRVPFAGRIEYCFFDKTGTLTSDQMVAIGIVSADSKDKQGDKTTPKPIANMKEASTVAAMCVAGCHSLLEVDGKVLGDPIEVAALAGVCWSYTPSNSTASPGAWRSKELFLAKQKEWYGGLRDDIEADKKEKEEMKKNMDELEKEIVKDKKDAKNLQCVIEQRFHFSSELQRMSTVCRVSTSGAEKTPAGTYLLTKGSPEAIAKLLSSKPDWYDATYKALAEKGQRVLALAYRHLDSSPNAAPQYGKKSRDEVEKDMTFAGFASFKCETRADTGLVIKALQDSAHHCVMLTGDAPLTALSVARETGFAKFAPAKSLVLTGEDEQNLEWTPALEVTAAADAKPIKFDPAGLEELSREHDLIVTGKGLELAFSREDVETFRCELKVISIFARMTPVQKEQVIRAVKDTQKVATFMCGDGGNDVGALKEADVGLALLSGFGNANIDKKKRESTDEARTKDLQEVEDAESALAELRKENSAKAQALSKKANEELQRKRKDLMSKQQQWVEEELQARRDRGEDVGIMAQAGALKAVMGRLKNELKTEQEAMQKKHGNSFAAGAAKWAGDAESLEDTPMVQLGDASTAAPFTFRQPSISASVDIIRQGRCTLLSAVQQMQIMMLESMISAYTMSTMSVDGTRPSEAQMMASGTLMSVASIAFSFARPLDRMHKVRPINSVFHPSAFLSLMGQLAIHLGCMVYIASLAKDIMGPDALKEIIDFEKERNKKIEGMDEEAFNAWDWFLSVPFKNNLLNTCCWLVETSQQISVIIVNYKGRPWMKGVLENQPLFLSLIGCIALVWVCARGDIPYLNELLNLVDVPEDLRPQVMMCLFISLIGSFLWDRLMSFIFAPLIFHAQLDEVKATTLADFMPLLKTVGCVGGGLVCLGSGNPLLIAGGFYMYHQYKKSQAPAAPAAALAAAPA